MTPVSDTRRTRGGPSYPPSRTSISVTPNGNSSGILPTPDPTIGSCMSEEDKDVALQLMRLGEMSTNSHGRTSASTLDDTFSGRADAASSTGATSEAESESEEELPPARRQKREHSPILPPGTIRRLGKHLEDNLTAQESTEMSSDEPEYDDRLDPSFKPDSYSEPFGLAQMNQPTNGKPRSRPQSVKPRSKSAKPTKPTKGSRPTQASKPKAKSVASVAGSRPPISPTSMSAHSRKASVSSALNFQHQLGDDEEDLSSKPRCQRCRKSKKGCDRQRPCQRCKDAGLSADQCVSEDEGNGRKGRYGRHMGVPVKKDEIVTSDAFYAPEVMPGGMGSPDKSKKRKR
jgi:hypothetical protein